MMEKLAAVGCRGICVTFLDELSECPGCVSMMSTLLRDDPEKRSFKIIRKKADGLAYAVQLTEKYGLSYEKLSRRLEK